MNAKTIAFTLMMGVLGNVLFAISSFAVPLAFGIALDFSLIAVFIAGFYGGPLVGFVSGLFVGLMPGIMFGPMGMGSWLGLFGLPLGKAMTGLTSGFVGRSASLGNRRYSSLWSIPTTLLSYVPEGIFTYAYFAYLMPLFLGMGGAAIFIYGILPKAIGEVVVISVLMAALTGNKGFNDFLRTFFPKNHTPSRNSPKEDLIEVSSKR